MASSDQSMFSNYKTAQGGLRKILKLQKELDHLPVDIGKVLVSSGQLVSPNLTRLDWAFMGKKITEPSFIPPADRPNELPPFDALT